ncbi:MAG: hypothetical protein LBH03_02360 [Holophagales bacterium]|jgi:hypothetical protein|nr:hypothetical protein [Holophagales bacterium]
MFTYHFILSAIFQICLLFSSFVAFAQNHPGQWADDLYLMNCYTNSFSKMSSGLVDENNKIHKIIPDLARVKGFFRPPNADFTYSNWHNGALYAIAEGGMGKMKMSQD